MADERLKAMESHTANVFAPDGYLEQAAKAQASGGLAALEAFLSSLWTSVQPALGPLFTTALIGLIQKLLPAVTPTPPAPKA